MKEIENVTPFQFCFSTLSTEPRMNEWMNEFKKKKEEENETKFGRFPFLFLFDFLFGQLFRNAKKRPKKSNKSWWDNEDGGYSIKREIRKKKRKISVPFHFYFSTFTAAAACEGPRHQSVGCFLTEFLPSFFFIFSFLGFFLTVDWEMTDDRRVRSPPERNSRPGYLVLPSFFFRNSRSNLECYLVLPSCLLFLFFMLSSFSLVFSFFKLHPLSRYSRSIV